MNIELSTPDAMVSGVVRSASGVNIGGEVRSNGPRLDLVAPADGAVWTEVATGTTQDGSDAADLAAATLPTWAAVPVPDRIRALRAIADELDAAAAGQEWPALITRETGKRLAEARGELSFSALYFRTFADLADSQNVQRFTAVPGLEHTVEARPLGVAAVMTPWNFPVSIPARKIAPALAAGCTVLFKPSELAPLSSMALTEVVNRHVPAGVLGTVLGEPHEVSDPWMAHPAVRGISFTGSTRVGRLVAQAAAPYFLRTVLELGGCAPFVVLPDADVEHAVETLMIAKYRNNGQSCIAANQIFVAREVAEPFVEAFVAASEDLIVGDPTAETTDVGPMAPAGDPARLAAVVDATVAAGAKVAGTRPSTPADGHWFAPTVLVDVPMTSAASSEEIFGPVAPISVYDDLDAAIATHLSTGYGLAGYVCGTDLDKARSVAGRLRAGIVGINTGTPNYPGAPFGGVGLSGLGYEGGSQGLSEFQQFRTTASGAADR